MYSNLRRSILGLVLCTAFPPAQAALISRLGGTAYYDDQLDITWLTNANLSASETFGVAGISSGGLMNWNTAQDWIAAMNSSGGTGYLGFSNWRLPDVDINNDFVIESCSTGSICLDNEFGHMYYFNNVSDSSPAPFPPLYFSYWSGTETSGGAFAYRHYIDLGTTIYEDKFVQMGVWAVRSGDVMAVPLPAAGWLLGSGLVGLVGVARKKRQPDTLQCRCTAHAFHTIS